MVYPSRIIEVSLITGINSLLNWLLVFMPSDTILQRCKKWEPVFFTNCIYFLGASVISKG